MNALDFHYDPNLDQIKVHQYLPTETRDWSFVVVTIGAMHLHFTDLGQVSNFLMDIRDAPLIAVTQVSV